MAQACCPPAPPKQANTWRDVSRHLACVSARIGRHIDSLATRMNPMATSSLVIGAAPPCAAANSLTSLGQPVKRGQCCG
jgi:hypothetical protein